MALKVNTQRRVFKGVGNSLLLVMVLWTAIPLRRNVNSANDTTKGNTEYRFS